MVECTQTIPLPWGGREVVYKRLSVKVHQTQVKGKNTEWHKITSNSRLPHQDILPLFSCHIELLIIRRECTSIIGSYSRSIYLSISNTRWPKKMIFLVNTCLMLSSRETTIFMIVYHIKLYIFFFYRLMY